MNLLSKLIGVSAALAGVCIAAAPALAAGDGTSNTIQIAEVTLDQAHHRAVVVGAESASRLTPGLRLRAVQVVTPSLKYTFSDVMVESLTGTSSALSLNFTKVELAARGGCTPGVDACLMEPDGIYPPFA